jgi:galactokinase/CTP:molybdopterin cytidylyltransferase MocA
MGISEILSTVELKRLVDISVQRLSDELNQIAANPSTLEYLSDARDNSSDLIIKALLLRLTKTYGLDLNTISKQIQRLGVMCAQFVNHYGEGPVSLLRAPARINILGEHVDYVSYLPTQSLPFGSREHDMLMLYRASQTDRVRGASTAPEYPSFSFVLSDGPISAGGEPGTEWLSYLFANPAGSPHWKNYVIGPAYLNRLNQGTRLNRGFDFLVDSGIPAGGGASSSSALVVLASAAVRLVNNIAYSPLELAREASRAEWYVGTRGGAMDHLTISLAKTDHAVLISYSDQQAEQISLPGGQFRWLTFFSMPADKGREVMIEYNERAAVSRIVLPAVIEGWKQTKPDIYVRWQLATQDKDAISIDAIEELLTELPETLTLAEIEQIFPESYLECAQSFPALVAERHERRLQVRLRALHHVGEIRRVSAAASTLHNLTLTGPDEHKIDTEMRKIGALLDRSHESLRDLYGVSTGEVEELTNLVRNSPGVYGARLMGGGFGGNVLALTRADQVGSLVARVQSEYYEPRGRDGFSEGSIMISTPGDGLAPIDIEDVFREGIENLNSAEVATQIHRDCVRQLLDSCQLHDSHDQVWPIIVAAGKGTRSIASGLTTPKPLASILGKTALARVIENTRQAFGRTRTPIVIVSPETESETKALLNEEVLFMVQPVARGTGDAVWCAREHLRDFDGHVLVIWGTQPVVLPATMLRTLKLASLYPDYDMVLPTADKPRPYAPLVRNSEGRVKAASETHLEKAEQLTHGESNIGMFLLKSESMLKALDDLHNQYWDENEGRYDRPSGELGFPNELINYFAQRNQRVFASPFADSREEQGIKTLSDVALCEQFISELANQQN